MEGRNQFTFYRSFFEAIRRIRKKTDRCDAYDAIVGYALDELEPDLDLLSDAATIAFVMSRPILESGRKKAESGMRGGNARQTESKPQAKEKQTESKKEDKDKNKNKYKIEDKCYPQSPLVNNPAVAEVMTAYLNKVNPSASQRSIDELKGYIEVLGPDVCLRAIDVALDAKKANWNYIRAILRNLQAKGVTCLADWDAIEATRDTTKATENTTPGGEFSPGGAELEAVRRLKAEMEAKRNGGQT